MREHRIRSIEIGNKDELLRQIPEFDLYELAAIESIHIAWSSLSDEPDLSLVIVGAYGPAEEPRRVKFRFFGVRQLTLPELSERGLFLNELELEDVSGQQLEGVRFRLENYGTESFSLSCRSLEFVSVT